MFAGRILTRGTGAYLDHFRFYCARILAATVPCLTRARVRHRFSKHVARGRDGREGIKWEGRDGKEWRVRAP